jgi:hypothetical protein
MHLSSVTRYYGFERTRHLNEKKKQIATSLLDSIVAIYNDTSHTYNVLQKSKHRPNRIVDHLGTAHLTSISILSLAKFVM